MSNPNKLSSEQVLPVTKINEESNHNMFKENKQSVIDINPFNQCFYGCKLDKYTLKWSCKNFSSVKEADKYALANRDSSIATRLIPVYCIETNLPNFYKKYKLFMRANFHVNIDSS